MTRLEPQPTETETPQAPSRTGHRPAFLAAAVVVLLLGAATALLARDPGAGSGHTQPTQPPATTTTIGDTAAATQLAAIADLITASREDNQPGRYAYLEIEHWSRREGIEIVGFHERRWRPDDGSGLVIKRQLPGQPARGFDMNQIGRTDFTGVSPEITSHGPGEIPHGVRIDAQPSSDMNQLLRQLDSVQSGMTTLPPCPPQCDPASPPHVLLDAVIGLHHWDYLNRDVREAVLRIVAGLAGLAYHGDAVDRAGRSGVAVSLPADGARITLVFDRVTGYLLASQRTGSDAALDDYTLYTTHRRTDSLG